MLSNWGFWSNSGELWAVHGVGPADPSGDFGPWAAARRWAPGRLVRLSSSFPAPPAPGPGWHALPAAPRFRPGRPPRPVDAAAPVATPAPALDAAAARMLPNRFTHPQFTLRAWPTWTLTAEPDVNEGPEGWFAAVGEGEKTGRFVIRLVPVKGRLPGAGWRNMLAWALKAHHGVRLVPLNAVPAAATLGATAAWEYRVDAGSGTETASWDVQILPSRTFLAAWAPGTEEPWEATALLRWVRPGLREPLWSDLWGQLPVADARVLVQNVLTTLPGGAGQAAVLFYDTLHLAPDTEGRSRVRHVPLEGLPVALLSTLFGRRAWREVERARRFPPPDGEVAVQRAEILADVDLRLAEGRLIWSEAALDLWQTWYRDPRHRAAEAQLAACRASDRWVQALALPPRVLETVLRGLDVTDAALCLRDAPDTRWRRYVTAHREAELKAELEFCRLWDARGELTVERQLDAWVCWDALVEVTLET